MRMIKQEENGFMVHLKCVRFRDETGVEQRFQLNIENRGEEEISEVFCLQPPINAEPSGMIEIELTRLMPGEGVEVQLSFTFRTGGSHMFYGWIKGRQTPTLYKKSVFLSGGGYYSGDTHTHSVYSDGKGTLEENRDSMMEKGHSFLYSTDHNTMEQSEEISQFHRRPEASSFLHIAGWEFTSQYGHALAYDTAAPTETGRITERGKPEEWQAFVDEMREAGGFVYLAHPFEAPQYEFGDRVLGQLRGITGIEVWNGFNHHALSYQNRKAFLLWDELNLSGRGRYMGIAVSDAHTPEKQGNPFIKGYMEELSAGALHQMLQEGKFFGSNGPEIELYINGVSMGGICTISEPTMVHGTIKVFDPLGGLEEVILYRGKIQNGKEAPADKKTVKVMDTFPAKKGCRSVWQKDWYFQAEPGEFYRVEAVSEAAAVAIREKGFAFSNPVWIA